MSVELEKSLDHLIDSFMVKLENGGQLFFPGVCTV